MTAEEREAWRDEIHLTANYLAEDILTALEETERELRLARYLLRWRRNISAPLTTVKQGDAMEAYLYPNWASDRERAALDAIRRELEARND